MNHLLITKFYYFQIVNCMEGNTDKLEKSFQKYFDSLDNQELSGEENNKIIRNVVNEYKLSSQERKPSIFALFKHKLQVSYSYRQSFYKTAIAATILLCISAGTYLLYRDYYSVPDKATKLTEQKGTQKIVPSLKEEIQKEITISKSVELAYIPLKIKSYGFTEKLNKEKISDSELSKKALNIAEKILTNSNIRIASKNEKEILSGWNYYVNKDGKRTDSRLRIKLINNDKMRLSIIQEEAVLSGENQKISVLIKSSLCKDIIKNIKKDYYNYLESK